MYPSEFVREGIKNIPLQKRQTQRKLAAPLGVSKTTVQRWIVDSTIRVHCNSLKPVLTEENKVAQLIMALESRDPNDPSKFLDMMDRVHVDEKWFFLSRQRERYLLLPDEKNPKRCVKSKSHITKVMFLCAVVRPRFNTSANSWRDGKLSIWPIGGWEPAQRASKNRPRGTLVWKNKPVTKGVIESYSFLSCCQRLLKNGCRQTGYRERFGFSKTEPKAILTQTMGSSDKQYKIRNSMRDCTHKRRTRQMSTYLILGFFEQFKILIMRHRKTKRN